MVKVYTLENLEQVEVILVLRLIFDLSVLLFWIVQFGKILKEFAIELLWYTANTYNLLIII